MKGSISSQCAKSEAWIKLDMRRSRVTALANQYGSFKEETSKQTSCVAMNLICPPKTEFSGADQRWVSFAILNSPFSGSSSRHWSGAAARSSSTQLTQFATIA